MIPLDDPQERNLYFDKLLVRVITDMVKSKIEVQVEEAKRRVEADIRGETAAIVARCCRKISYEPFGKDQLKIVIDFKELDEWRVP